MSLFYSAVHLNSKKHRYHVKKKSKSDPGPDLPQSAAAPPVSAGSPPSQDSCAAVTLHRKETSQDSSEDTTTHTGVPMTLLQLHSDLFGVQIL